MQCRVVTALLMLSVSASVLRADEDGYRDVLNTDSYWRWNMLRRAEVIAPEYLKGSPTPEAKRKPVKGKSLLESANVDRVDPSLPDGWMKADLRKSRLWDGPIPIRMSTTRPTITRSAVSIPAASPQAFPISTAAGPSGLETRAGCSSAEAGWKHQTRGWPPPDLTPAGLTSTSRQATRATFSTA